MEFNPLEKLFNSLRRTRESLTSGLRKLSSKINPESIQEIETLLLAADVGVVCTEQILDSILKNSKETNIIEIIHRELLEMLGKELTDKRQIQENNPRVIFVVGVNGTGKTTSAAKLAYYYSKLGKSVLLIGADTYRAAGVEQLRQWSISAEIQFISNESSRDPSAVLFDGIKSAQAKSIDISVVDTAGRLHTYRNLMAELEKMYRVLSLRFADFEREILLTLDANLGQNSLIQARKFHELVMVDGIILTKMDGTAKGGIIFPIYQELSIPVKFLGIGETLHDIIEFQAEDYVNSLLGGSAI